MIYVIGAHESIEEQCQRCRDTIKQVLRINNRVNVEIFIHKIDTDMYRAEEKKIKVMADVKEIVDERDIASELGIQTNFAYFLTSIYDHTIYEAISKVVQKLLPQVKHIATLMDNLVNASRLDNAFLFDVLSKVYIAKDQQMDELGLYEICAELIDVLIDVTCIYGMEEGGSFKFDKDSSSVIKLEHPEGKEGNVVIYLREVEKCLALVCIVKESEFAQKQLIDYNIDKFKEGLTEIFIASEKAIQE